MASFRGLAHAANRGGLASPFLVPRFDSPTLASRPLFPACVANLQTRARIAITHTQKRWPMMSSRFPELTGSAPKAREPLPLVPLGARTVVAAAVAALLPAAAAAIVLLRA
jgi:hypothetical protein